AGYVRVDEGTPQEMYVWPYFVRMSLSALTPQQKVELFRIVTGADYKDMMKLGVYAFYRLGIGPDGTWHFFVTVDSAHPAVPANTKAALVTAERAPYV